jgi:hypothetical protein
MSHNDATERILALQALVEKLQREKKELLLEKRLARSTGKYGATMPTGKKAQSVINLGPTRSTPTNELSQPSTRSEDSRKPGTNEPDVLDVMAPSTRAVSNHSITGQDGLANPAVSTVTAVTSSSQTGVALESNKTVKDTAVVAPPAMARHAPRTKGASFMATSKAGPVIQSDKPLLSATGSAIRNGILPRTTKREIRRDACTVADPELVSYLRNRFAFKPRTSDMWDLMHVKLTKHLETHDLTQFTETEIYNLSIMAVAAAIPIPEAEQRVRAAMKDKATLEEMEKHRLCFQEGMVGKTGAVFKTQYRMPPKTK